MSLFRILKMLHVHFPHFLLSAFLFAKLLDMILVREWCPESPTE